MSFRSDWLNQRLLGNRSFSLRKKLMVLLTAMNLGMRIRTNILCVFLVKTRKGHGKDLIEFPFDQIALTTMSLKKLD